MRSNSETPHSGRQRPAVVDSNGMLGISRWFVAEPADLSRKSADARRSDQTPRGVSVSHTLCAYEKIPVITHCTTLTALSQHWSGGKVWFLPAACPVWSSYRICKPLSTLQDADAGHVLVILHAGYLAVILHGAPATKMFCFSFTVTFSHLSDAFIHSEEQSSREL